MDATRHGCREEDGLYAAPLSIVLPGQLVSYELLGLRQRAHLRHLRYLLRNGVRVCPFLQDARDLASLHVQTPAKELDSGVPWLAAPVAIHLTWRLRGGTHAAELCRLQCLAAGERQGYIASRSEPTFTPAVITLSSRGRSMVCTRVWSLAALLLVREPRKPLVHAKYTRS